MIATDFMSVLEAQINIFQGHSEMLFFTLLLFVCFDFFETRSPYIAQASIQLTIFLSVSHVLELLIEMSFTPNIGPIIQLCHILFSGNLN